MKFTPVIAILALVFITCFALAMGVDGAVFITAAAAIAGLGGYEVKAWRVKREDKTKYVVEYLKKAGYTETYIRSVIKKVKGGE